jgi:tetratricopeptide (TPR) repeat protein
MIRFVSILMLCSALRAHAQSAADKLTAAGIVEFTAAYQTWDGTRFAAASDLFRQASTNAAVTATNFYWLGVSEFHRALQLQCDSAHAVGADAALASAIEALNQVVKLGERQAESNALLGTIYGMKINGSVLRAAWFGPRVAKHRAKAMELGATNPRVQYLLGMCQFHTANTPAAWRETLATLLAAEKLFEAEARTAAAPLAPRWGYDSCLTFLGRIYEKLEQPKEAAEYFRKALAIHPQDHIAQDGLKRVAAKK